MYGAILGAGLGLTQGAINNQQNKEGAKRQLKGQKELNEQAAGLALQQWKDTNYGAQVREMKKAGVSTGLLYGGGGAGGATAQTGSGGSAAAQAPSNYDIGGMALQGAQTAANLELTKAQTKKTNVEAAKIAGADTDNTTADTGQKVTNTELTKQSMKSLVDKAFYDAELTRENSNIAGSTSGLMSETYEDKRKLIQNEAILSSIEIGAKEIGIELSKAQIQNMVEQIRIGKFNANINAEQMGLDKVQGTLLNKLVNMIDEKLGVGVKTKEIK